MERIIMKRIIFGLIAFFIAPLAFAFAPVVLTGPTPALLPIYSTGLPNTIVYTITNRVPKTLPIIVGGIGGPIKRTAVANDCGNLMAGLSTCNIGILIAPTVTDMGSFIFQVLEIYYGGRLPLTSVIAFTVSNSQPIPPPPPTGLTFAYVSDLSSNLWQCPIDLITGQFSSACLALTNTPPFSQTFFTTFNTFAAVTYAYVGTQSFSQTPLWKCPIDNATGAFSICEPLQNTPPFFAPINATFATFSNSTYAYVSDESTNILWQCPIDTATGDFSGNCTSLTYSLTALSTQQTSFQTFNSVTYVYIPDHTSNVWQCPIIPATGQFITGTCIANTTPALGTVGITFNTFSNQTYAYVGDAFTPNLWKCPINTTTGQFGSCVALTDPSFAPSVSSATFHTFAGIVYAYVSDGSQNVWQCPIDTTTGNFSGPCVALSNPNFLATTSTTFQTF